MVMICKLVDTHILRIFSGIWYNLKQEKNSKVLMKACLNKNIQIRQHLRILYGSELRIFKIHVSSLNSLGVLIELVK